MQLLYHGCHLIHYGQVALWDREDRTSYPLPAGPLPWRGSKGLVVPACNDATIDLYIFEALANEKAPPETPSWLTKAEIMIGHEGLETGNVTTAMTAVIDWPPGPVLVRSYFAGPVADAAVAVSFTLTRIEAQ